MAFLRKHWRVIAALVVVVAIVAVVTLLQTNRASASARETQFRDDGGPT